MYFELITVILVVLVATFFWLRATRRANRMPPPPLWFTHVAQRLGILAEYKIKKAKWGMVLKGSRGGTSYNIGAFPSDKPEDLFVSVRRKSRDMSSQWLLYPKAASSYAPQSNFPLVSFGDAELDDFFVLQSPDDAAATLALFDKAAAKQFLQYLKNYKLQNWLIGIHEDTIYYKEAFHNPMHGNMRVDHLMGILDFLLLVGIEQPVGGNIHE